MRRMQRAHEVQEGQRATRAAALILDAGCVALIKRCNTTSPEPYYLFPGGRVEAGESPPETAVREVLEELGLRVVIGVLIARVRYQDSIQYYFTASITGGEFGTGEDPEMTKANSPEVGTYTPVWIPLADVLRRPVHPRSVAQIVVDAGTGGWPRDTIKLVDEGREYSRGD